MKGRLRMIVIDDLPEIRRLINIELDDRIEVVGEGSNGRDAISLVEETHPDVVLMDIEMPIMNGIDATREIHERFPDVVVLGFTGSSGEGVEAMIDAGATSVVGKDEIDQLMDDLEVLIDRPEP